MHRMQTIFTMPVTDVVNWLALKRPNTVLLCKSLSKQHVNSQLLLAATLGAALTKSNATGAAHKAHDIMTSPDRLWAAHKQTEPVCLRSPRLTKRHTSK